jgi:hypothetical protein
MGCNCKNTDGPQQYDVLREKEALSGIIVKYLAKTIGFLVGVALLPIIMLVIIWFMFDTIVLNKDIDLRTVINRFVKANEFFSKNDEDDDDEEDDDDDDEFEELTEDDVIMINVEDITEKSK